MSWSEEARKLNLLINGLPTTVNTSTATAIAALPAAARSGSYSDLLNKPSVFTPPIATTVILGGIKVGTGLNVTGDGTLSVDALGGVQSINTRTGAITLVAGDITAALTFTPTNNAQKGVANGHAGLDGTAKVPLTQLPQIPISQVTLGTTFATVATSGLYSDLISKPTFATVATSGSYTDLTNKPSLAAVATSGSYADLSSKPTTFAPPVATASVLGGIKVGTGLTVTAEGLLSSTGGYTLPAATAIVLGGVKAGAGVSIAVDGTLTASSAVSSVAGRTGAVVIAATDVSGLATVARTGVYSDLTGRPSVVSAFTNDAGFQTAAQVSAAVQAVVGAAPDALNTLAEIATALQSDSSALSALITTVGTKANTASLSAVATSGSYADLTNKPSIPTAYTLPAASVSVLGGVKAGTGVDIAVDGTISATGGGGSATSTALITTWTGTPYDIFFSVYGPNADSEVIHRLRAVRAFTIGTNFSGSSAKSEVVATAQTVYSVKKNGIPVATITFAAGANTGTFSAQAAISFAIGDLLQVVTQSTADTTLADIDFSIVASLN